MECAWGAGRNELDLCGDVEYVLAFICDKCNNTAAIELCPVHLDMWENRIIHCIQCNGTISWEAKHIITGETKCRFNPSTPWRFNPSTPW